MLQRNLLYTAITRAKQMVVIVGTQKALRLAIENDEVARRYTTLKERLRDEVGEVLGVGESTLQEFGSDESSAGDGEVGSGMKN